jgi:hypothetical protein
MTVRSALVPLDGSGEKMERGMAIKTNPYYSIDPTDPDVWHDYSNCPNGQQIPAANRRLGKPAGYRRCHSCERMD